MKEQPSALPGEEPEGARNPTNMAQSEFGGEKSSWKATQDTRWDLSKGMQQHWEAQWQEFLKTLQFPHSAWGSPQLAETTLWDDAKAFLTSFEQVAQACQWPREEWVARLLPALSGEAQQAFGSLEARDKEDYGKVKAAILRGEASRMETLRQHFRQFRSREVDDPRRIYSQLQDLCCQWLRPERHSKEQILELLILEQFLAILPPELQSWIRAGGPENCTQAAALVDDFLLSQQKVETWKWQEPLQEMIRGSLEAAGGAPLDFGHRRLAKETKQNSNRDASLLDSGMKCPGDSENSLPPKEQEATKAGMAEAPVGIKETGMSLHVVEPAQAKPGQRTMFWQVMQEEEGNADSLEGLLVPKSDLASHLEKDNEMFVQFPEESERLTGQGPGYRRSQIKAKGSDMGESVPKEAQRTVTKNAKWDFLETSEIHKQRCKLKGQQEKKPMEGEKEHSQAVAGFPPSPSKMNPEQKKSLFSRYGRRYHYKPGLVIMQTSENPDECPTGGDNILQKSCLDVHQRLCVGEEQCEVSEYFEKDCQSGSQANAVGEKPYECPDCGNCFSWKWSLKRHQAVKGHYTKRKPFECVKCGKCFNQKEHMKKHWKLHSGGLHRCPECGKNFPRKGTLMRHLRIHTGEKPYECPQCRKCFGYKQHFMIHQRIHTGEKPFKCSECEKSFSRRDVLLRHQRIHRR